MDPKQAETDAPVHALIAARWSPYAYSARPVSEADLRSLFEAARWAPSSYNEQPWSYIVARRERPEATPRQRRPTREFVFEGAWLHPADFVGKA